jgi:hypothetical protein
MHRSSFLLRSAAAAAIAAGAAQAQISFQGPIPIALQGLRPDWVATGDFDGDGDQDFAVSTGQASGSNGPDWVEIHDNNGSGAFSLSQALVIGNNVSTAALVAADFDSDGDLDLAVSLHDTGAVRILPNSGGVFALGGSVATGGLEPRHMVGGDLDADGDVDLETSNRASNDLSRLLNDGSGNLSFAGLITVGTEPRHLAIDDLDGDCLLDIAVAAHDSRRVDLMFNLGGGSFTSFQSIPVPGNEKPSGMVAADLDADGDVDLATTTDNNNLGLFVVLTNTGAGAFTAATFASGGSNPDAIVAFDLDGDGDKDLAAADEDSSLVSAVANVGGTSFGAPGTFAVGVHPTSLAGSDFDGNGSIDLIVANRDTNNVTLLRNAIAGGAETYCHAKANSVGAGARIDFDGSLGIAANQFTLHVRCAPPNRNGVFFYGANPTNVPFGGGRRCVAPPVARLGPVGVTSATGRLQRLVNFTQPPAGSGPAQITAGSTWYFQFWYRDQNAGSFTNLSDALSATFRP